MKSRNIGRSTFDHSKFYTPPFAPWWIPGNSFNHPNCRILVVLHLREFTRSSHRLFSFSFCQPHRSSPTSFFRIRCTVFYPLHLKIRFLRKKAIYFIRACWLLLLFFPLLFSSCSAEIPIVYTLVPLFQRARALPRESRNACARLIPSRPIQSHRPSRSTYCQPPM